MEQQHIALQVLAAPGEGAASFDLSAYSRITIQSAGITSSVLNLEATMDGTNWIPIKPTLANFIYSVESLIAPGVSIRGLRVNTVSIGGGETPTVTFLAQTLGY
jgi:hypothetical protein